MRTAKSRMKAFLRQKTTSLLFTSSSNNSSNNTSNTSSPSSSCPPSNAFAFATAKTTTALFPSVDPSVDGDDCDHDCASCTISYPRKFNIDEDDRLFGHVKSWSTHLIVATGKS